MSVLIMFHKVAKCKNCGWKKNLLFSKDSQGDVLYYDTSSSTFSGITEAIWRFFVPYPKKCPRCKGKDIEIVKEILR